MISFRSLYDHWWRFFLGYETATTEIYTAWHTLSPHDARPISVGNRAPEQAGPGGIALQRWRRGQKQYGGFGRTDREPGQQHRRTRRGRRTRRAGARAAH